MGTGICKMTATDYKLQIARFCTLFMLVVLLLEDTRRDEYWQRLIPSVVHAVIVDEWQKSVGRASTLKDYKRQRKEQKRSHLKISLASWFICPS
jgi:hypothetical protein